MVAESYKNITIDDMNTPVLFSAAKYCPEDQRIIIAKGFYVSLDHVTFSGSSCFDSFRSLVYKNMHHWGICSGYAAIYTPALIELLDLGQPKEKLIEFLKWHQVELWPKMELRARELAQ